MAGDSRTSSFSSLTGAAKGGPPWLWRRLGCSAAPRCGGVQERCCEGEDSGERDDEDSAWVRSPHDDFDDPYAEALARGSQKTKPNLLESLSVDIYSPERRLIPWATLSVLPKSGLPPTPAMTAPPATSLAAPSAGCLPRSRSAKPSINPVTGFISLVVPACEYGPACADDPIDEEFVRQLQRLHKDSAASMMVRRLAPGSYEIDGTRVTMSFAWQPSRDAALVGGADATPPVVVKEDGVRGKQPVVPLTAYLEQASMIAVQITPAAPRTLTFENEGAPLARADECDRLDQMQLACHQARVREEAAYAFSQG